MDITSLNKGKAMQDKINDLQRIIDVLKSHIKKGDGSIELLVEFFQGMNNVSGPTKKKELAKMCLDKIVADCIAECEKIETEFAEL